MPCCAPVTSAARPLSRVIDGSSSSSAWRIVHPGSPRYDIRRSRLTEMRHSLVVLSLLLVSVCAAGCDDPQRERWIQALRDCGITDVTPAHTLYFGPSSSAGPGSGWRETFDRKRRHVDYRIRVGTDELPEPTAFIRPSPSGYQCKGGRDVTLKLNIGVAARVSTLPLSRELSDALMWAREVRITVGGMGWDEINEAAYAEYVTKSLG